MTTVELSVPRCTLEDFENCGWGTVIADAASKDQRTVARALRSASRMCESNIERALRVLAEVLEMRLQPGELGGPYLPVLRTNTGRSFLRDDLDDEEFNAIAKFSEQVDFAPLAARLADIVWLHPKTKHTRFAERAIQAFTREPLEEQAWGADVDVSWHRALQIGKELGKAGKSAVTTIHGRLLEGIKVGTAARPRFVFDVAELLALNDERTVHAEEVATRLDDLAQALLHAKEFRWAAKLRISSSKWWQIGSKPTAVANSLSEAVEVKIAEAAEISRNGRNGAFATAPLFEEAIELLRSIPQKERALLRFEERIAELRVRLRDAQITAFDQMASYVTPIPHAAEMADDARNAVQGKPFIRALGALVSLHRVVPRAQLFQRAQDNGEEFLSRRLMSSRMVAPDGRTVAKVPPLPFETEASEARSQAVHADVVQQLTLTQNVFVQTAMIPALRVLNREHHPNLSDFTELCTTSPVVARDRIGSTASGLYAGFNWEFRTALYLLVPQLENLTRRFIQSHGGHTSTIIDGIEQEKGLSTLMFMPEAQKVFGEDLGLELFVLFCDSLGPNLRNQVAHGLLSDGEASSTQAAFAWWFMLRLVMWPLMPNLADGADLDSDAS